MARTVPADRTRLQGRRPSRKNAPVGPDRASTPVTLRDVAAAAGVHPATASRALNPATRPLVNDETARRVLEAAERLGYRPNPIARGLKTNRSFTIGVVVPDLRNPLFPPIARGIEERLEPAGYTSLLANTDNAHEREKLSFEALRARQVDGFITGTARRRHPLLRELADTGIPVVQVNRRMDDDDLPSVVADDVGGVRLALDHLLALGHTRIAHVAGSLEVSTGEHRYHAFLDAMAERGLDVDPRLTPTALNYSEAEGARLTRALLEAGGPAFTAIVAGNDLMALGCIDALHEAGLSCPEDVSVVGFNDMDWSDRFSPPLTTVRVPHHELGVRAADLLLARLADPLGAAEHLVLDVALVVRGSTAPVAEAASAPRLTARPVAP
jgi:LacI family transcriptional regulator